MKRKTEEFLNHCREENYLLSMENEQTKLTNERMKLFLDEWQSVEQQRSNTNIFSGGNDATKSVVYELDAVSHIIPPNCRFFNINALSVEPAKLADAYDLIVMDPPWWNKYIRRSRKFNRENG